MEILNILIVEDDPVTRKLLEKKLLKEGYEVECANNGSKAIDLLSEKLYDVVLTDLMLPGNIDGIGVLEYSKSKREKTEVILITAYASVESAVKTMKKGAADYLTKPINIDELLIRLAKISAMKSLAKNADELREAMDVTEKTASQTIHELEFMISDLQHTFSSIKNVLGDEAMNEQKRIKKALDLLVCVSE
jgi:DNA-binding NtrC family response regulator